MKTVYSSPNITLVHHFKNILEGCGISCQIRKEHLSSGAGDLPPTDCWPELCVADEGLFAEASRLLEETPSPAGDNGVGRNASGVGKQSSGSLLSVGTAEGAVRSKKVDHLAWLRRKHSRGSKHCDLQLARLAPEGVGKERSKPVGLTHNAAPELTLEEDSWDRRLAETPLQLEMAHQKLMLANPAHDLTIFMVAEYASLFRPTSSASEHTRRH